ncbi:MAG: hypothetical protein WKG32_16045 [Gemmatimonadaceae bacterium]
MNPRMIERLALSLLSLLPAALPAQAAAPAAEYSVEIQVRDRWMHGRQQPRFTTFAQARSWLSMDSLRADSAAGAAGAAGAGQHVAYFTLGRFASGRDSGLIVFRRDGRVTALEASLQPRTRTVPYTQAGDSARDARRRLSSGGRVTLPASRLWELIPTFRPARLRAGARWADTLALATEQEGFRQSLRGTRVSTLVGDTTVGGQRLWVVRDSARVHYEERSVEEERTLDTLVSVERSADGVICGWHLYDPSLGLFRVRSDTTLLSGEAVLRYPDGRAFRTPARYERFRQWDLYDAAAFAARQAGLQAERERVSGGMVIVPTTDIARRLAAGDSAARDSLLDAWRRSDDPDERARLFGLVSMWGARAPGIRARLDSMRVAAGDTAFLYAWLARRAYSPSERADVADMRQMIAFMEEPGWAFALNVSRDWLYENLRQGLLTWPPAVAADTGRRMCTPDACRLLAEQWPVAREPRLRELGLVTLVALDPARWSDTVLARARAGSRFLDPAVLLVRGVGATWPAAAKAELPPPAADWRAWMEWTSGTDPRVAATAAPPPPARPPEWRVRFEESHATAIRFYQARTGRDVIGELRRGFAQAESDSARLVYGTMLGGLGALRLSVEEIATYLRGGSPALVALGTRELARLFRDPPPRADSATALLLLDRLIATLVEGAPGWPSLRARSDSARPPRGARPEANPRPTRPVFLLADSLPPALRAKWKDRAAIVTSEEWARRSLREPGDLYTLSSVGRIGPFVRLYMDAAGRLARREDQAPALYGSGTTYYLMELNGEWVAVSISAWVS